MQIAGHKINKGARNRIKIPIAHLFDNTELTIQAEIIRGFKPGPTIFISGTIHGDETLGSEVIKRFLQSKKLTNLKAIKGTIIAIPIVNPFGYNNNSRYLPDRRDLNRCFPGATSGSLASMIAYTFLNKLIKKCNYGIDIHSGAIHRTNVPQIRVDIKDKATLDLAHAFNPPIIVHSPLRPNTLRAAAKDLGIPTLLFESGEALRVDEESIAVALNGIFNVLNEIGLLASIPIPRSNALLAKTSYWIRAPHSGSIRMLKTAGDKVAANEVIGIISDPFDEVRHEVIAAKPGIIIGHITVALVTKADALFHIAMLQESDIQGIEDIVFDYEADIENEMLR